MAAAIQSLHPLFAAEVGDLDPASPETVGLLDHYAVLVFRNQPLDDTQQIALSAGFGPLEYSVGARKAGHDRRLADERIVDVSNLDAHGLIRSAADTWRRMQKANELWHTDSSFKRIPGRISLLSAREIPNTGAATEFADLRAAYDALDSDTQQQVRGLSAEHSMFYSRSLVGYEGFSERERVEYPPVARPLVRRHPGSRRDSLYLAAHASHIIGLPRIEGRQLLDRLTEHATQPRFVYSHQWRQYDLVIWDNRCTMHRARPYDDINMRRDMRRTTVSDVSS